MRLIFTILLIGLFKANAQMVINASSPYRPIGGFAYLLDDYSGARVAYSLRKLDKDYTGSAIRIRKDTTGQPEQDIGFVNNELDTSSLKSFLNARSGFVVRWYDQSGNGYDVGQSTQANQPRIALNGVIDRQNGKVTLVFDGSNDALTNSTNLNISGDITESVFITIKQNSTSGLQAFFSHGGNVSLNAFALWSNLRSTNQYEIGYVGNDYRTDKSTNTNFQLVSLIKTAGAINTTTNIWFNNVQAADRGGSSTSTPNIANSGLNICRNVLASPTIANTNANLSEFVLYTLNQTSNRSGIESNINLYYGIY
jgi:hypothetical protein